jgi:enoyl-CoA hydratase/carnithine racemase
MTYKTIDWKTVKNIGYLTLATPPGNEMDSFFFHEFSHIMEDIKSNKNLIGLIIQAQGRHFSSGANTDQLLSIFSGKEPGIPKLLKNNNEAFMTLSKLAIPVVACVKNICFGSGLELALCAHFRISSPNLLLSLPETGFGIMPGLGGIYNTHKCMGTAKTIQFVLSGNSIDAHGALESGLIDRIVAKNDLEKVASAIIIAVASNYKKEFKSRYLRELDSNGFFGLY